MSASVTFTVHGEPMSKARARVVNGHAFTPERTRVAEAGVLAAFTQAQGDWGTPGPDVAFEVEATFCNGTRQRRDIDNMVKLILDALNGHAWTDDVLVVGLKARKLYVPKTEARTEVRITQVPADLSHMKPCARCGANIKFYDSLIPKWCSFECRTLDLHESRARTCKHCNFEFIPSPHAKRPVFCSMACKNAHQTVTQACTECGASFIRPLSWATNGRPYCSPECRVAWHRKSKAKHARGTCSVCGGTTSKKVYTRCHACKVAATVSTSGPRARRRLADDVTTTEPTYRVVTGARFRRRVDITITPRGAA